MSNPLSSTPANVEFASTAAESVRAFANGGSLSAVFAAAIALADENPGVSVENQAQLGLALGGVNETELTVFTNLYGIALNKLGLAEKAQITYAEWRELLPDADLEETIDSIPAKLQKLFDGNKEGLIVIRNAYPAKPASTEEKQAIGALENGLRAHMQAHPLVILQGKPGGLKHNLSRKGDKLAFSRKVGF